MVDFMKRSLELAEEALNAQEVPVGCVFVLDGSIVAESRNTVNETRNPTRHAEINCIDIFIQYCTENKMEYKDKFRKISVYVTVEPCIMCAAALHNLAISEVFYGCANDRFGGKTVLDVGDFYNYKYVLSGDVMSDKAMHLLKQFYKGSNPLVPVSKTNKKQKINIH